jgi:hypothetical protein
MPGFVRTKADEAKWSKAKSAVSKQRGKSQESFTDRDWALTNHIFHEMKKTAMLGHSLSAPSERVGGDTLMKEYDLKHVVSEIRGSMQGNGNDKEDNAEHGISEKLGNHPEWTLKEIPISSLKIDSKFANTPPREPLDKPIVMYQGKIVDGRHRVAALQREGKTHIRAYVPTSKVKKSTDLLSDFARGKRD